MATRKHCLRIHLVSLELVLSPRIVVMLLLAIRLGWAAPLERKETQTPVEQQNYREINYQNRSTVLTRHVRSEGDNPSLEQIQELRHTDSNYRNLLFAYSEMIDILEQSEESRRKRAETDGSCDNIMAQLNREAVPRSVVCPYTYTCTYKSSRYPRHIISATCSPPHTGNCAEYGQTHLRVLARQDEGSWILQEDSEIVYYGCQSVESPSSNVYFQLPA